MDRESARERTRKLLVRQLQIEERQLRKGGAVGLGFVGFVVFIIGFILRGFLESSTASISLNIAGLMIIGLSAAWYWKPGPRWLLAGSAIGFLVFVGLTVLIGTIVNSTLKSTHTFADYTPVDYVDVLGGLAVLTAFALFALRSAGSLAVLYPGRQAKPIASQIAGEVEKTLARLDAGEPLPAISHVTTERNYIFLPGRGETFLIIWIGLFSPAGIVIGLVTMLFREKRRHGLFLLGWSVVTLLTWSYIL